MHPLIIAAIAALALFAKKGTTTTKKYGGDLTNPTKAADDVNKAVAEFNTLLGGL